MAVSRGKQFEDIVKKAFEAVKDTVIVRLHDQTTGYFGSKNPCDFLIYHKPVLYVLECKSVRGNTLPFSNITEFQWNSLMSMGDVQGVVAGILCWWIDRDVTLFIPSQKLREYKDADFKSLRYDIYDNAGIYQLSGKKKRVFFEYDMQKFFEEVNHVKGQYV